MKTKETETEIYRSAPPGLPAKEWHFPKQSKGESAHTPEPWIVEHDEGTGQAIVTHEAREICTVEDYYNDGEANAKLIAAAPETAAERDRLAMQRVELAADVEILVDERDQARAQRDELLAACKSAERELEEGVMSGVVAQHLRAAIQHVQEAQ